MAAVVEAAEQTWGPIEVLVNNAGRRFGWAVLGRRSRRLVAGGDDERSRPSSDVGRRPPRMLERQSGYIINVNSLGGMRPFPGVSQYSVSKAALARLTDCLAAELADTGVKVFDLSPGLVRTAMSDGSGLFDEVPAEEWTPIEKSVATVQSLLSGRYDDLSGRFIHAEDDLDDLLDRVRRSPNARQLRLTRAGEDDPLFS